MQFAVIGSVDGHLAPLQATLDDIEERGLQCVLQTGNVVVGAAHGGACIALLQARGVQCVQGEEDRRLVRVRRKLHAMRARLDATYVEELLSAYDLLESAQIEWLRSQPKRLHLTLEGLAVLVCHGSPGSQSEVLSADTPPTRFARQREVEPLDIILCGGAPAAYHRFVSGTLFAGPGPLCKAPGTAAYLLIDTDATPWQVHEQTIPSP